MKKKSPQVFFTQNEIAALTRAKIGYDKNQSDLAHEAGVKQSYMSEFLAGKKGAGPEMLAGLGFEPTPYYKRAKR